MLPINDMKLVLEDGQCFEGFSCGARGAVVGELVFNTSMVGYQEIISDPSYAGQIVVMTYPLMGQYGIADEDYESKLTGPSGLVIRDNCDTPSNFRSTNTLSEYLEERSIPCLCGPDTRMLTKIIREKSSVMAALVPVDMPCEQAVALIRSTKPEEKPAASVSCTHRWFSRTPNHKFDVVILDLGLKRSIVNELNRRDINVTVVPFNTSAEEILSFNPDGIVISSGPGDPSKLKEVIEVINKIKGRIPMCGIGLGHQLIALSYGASTVRLGCGHHGGAPIKDLSSGRIFTAELNHCLAVDRKSLSSTGLELTHENLLDSSVEGLSKLSDHVFSCEFSPEGSPGPQENDFFDRLVELMQN